VNAVPLSCCDVPDSHSRIGLGGILPKDVEDGSFTSRIRTSDDKLLQQLIGKKKAKAHITAKQEAALRPNAAAKAKQYAKPAAKKEESDDDEEGRAATFKSKTQKKKEKQGGKTVDSDDEDEETRAKRLDGSAAKEEEGVSNKEVATKVQVDAKATREDEDEGAEAIQPAPKKARTKPKSFLDEILAERSKKKSKKGKA
jgi:hypothetical protein